jgi:hypothetical protein
MNIQDTVNRIKEICLNHVDVKSFNVGNTWEQSTTKGDIYPAIWLELPVLIEYVKQGQKNYTFSLDVLMLAKNDDTVDELQKQSECETIADELIQAFMKYIKNVGIETATGLTVKNLNADMATGVRIDLKVNTNRECDLDGDFREVMIKQ